MQHGECSAWRHLPREVFPPETERVPGTLSLLMEMAPGSEGLLGLTLGRALDPDPPELRQTSRASCGRGLVAAVAVVQGLEARSC